mmetsp:Transcript_22219/g.47342  ORF Transcript_22219/g.47342 Transcript_22219/m.47342 type:complete len:151 (+) Transcript_22219:227-679(+)
MSDWQVDTNLLESALLTEETSHQYCSPSSLSLAFLYTSSFALPLIPPSPSPFPSPPFSLSLSLSPSLSLRASSLPLSPRHIPRAGLTWPSLCLLRASGLAFNCTGYTSANTGYVVLPAHARPLPPRPQAKLHRPQCPLLPAWRGAVQCHF